MKPAAIIKEIINSKEISVDLSFKCAQSCSRLLRDHQNAQDGRKIIINVLDNWNKLNTSTQEIWADLIESAGFYPYLDKEKEKLRFTNTSGIIRREFHKSDYLYQKYFHEEQKILNDILNSEKNLIVSAPTSFGKSLLIEEVVASKRHKNIVVIQPTLALLDETRKKLNKYKDRYKIIIRTSQAPANDRGNLFLLTAERVMEYPNLPQIDFFVIDEFYKLSAKRDDERCDILNNAFNLLITKFKCKFYLLGPNIGGISEGFAEKYNAEFYKTDYSLVDIQEIDIYSQYKDKFDHPRKYKDYKEAILFDLLMSLGQEQTIIYCSSPNRVREISGRFVKYLKKKMGTVKESDLSIVQWIKENVSERWGFIDCLSYQIGLHDGALQKHITSSIINYFNDGKLKYLFCTSTIIEGVNTSAKNVVYFDETKGTRDLDYFDYSNIKGRSGRFMIHYVGRVFNFNHPPYRKDIIVDIPFFEQNPVKDEVLIHLEDNDIKDKTSSQYKLIANIPEEEKALIKRNGLLVKGQKEILDILKKEINNHYELIAWTGTPGYRQLEYLLSLAWHHLLKKGETTKPMTLPKLVKVTFDYGKSKSISELVENNYKYFKGLEKNKGKNNDELYDAAISDAFQILRHWFHYKVPKWVNVLHELQKYVCQKNGKNAGSYAFYASQLENDFVRQNLSILVEYGVPKSAIDKLTNKIPDDLREDDVMKNIREKNLLSTSKLNRYEREKIEENL